MFQSVTFYPTQEAWQEGAIKGERYLLLVGEKTLFYWEELPKDPLCVGAIFPYVIYEEAYYAQGILAVQLEKEVHITFVPSMEKACFNGTLEDFSGMVLVVVDGFSAHIVTFLEALFEVTASAASILGGGSGKLTLVQEPLIFDTQGLHQDAALILSCDTPLGLGVGHGWDELMGPLMATKTDKNILQALNYKDAFGIYRQIVEYDSGKKLTSENFFSLAKCYPFGIRKYGSEMVVRDPIATDGTALVLVGEMEEGSVVLILKGEASSLVEAANEAASEAASLLKEAPKGAIVVDCVSRVLFLEEDFSQELAAIKKGIGAPMWGVLSLGEIANKHDGNIEFYNKTCVVGAV